MLQILDLMPIVSCRWHL